MSYPVNLVGVGPAFKHSSRLQSSRRLHFACRTPTKRRITCARVSPDLAAIRTHVLGASSVVMVSAMGGIQSAVALDGLAINGRLPDTQFSALVPFVFIGTLYVLALGTKDVGVAIMSYIKGDATESNPIDESPSKFPRQKGVSKDISYKLLLNEREKRMEAEEEK